MTDPRSKVRSYLAKKKMTQHQLAEKAGVSPAALSMLLSGRYPNRRPGLALALALERVTRGAVRHGDWILTSRHNSEEPSRGLNERSAAVSLANPARRSAAGGSR